MPKLWFIYASRGNSQPMSVTLPDDTAYDFEDLKPMIWERLQKGRRPHDPIVTQDDLSFWQFKQPLQTDKALSEYARLDRLATKLKMSAGVRDYLSAAGIVKLGVWDRDAEKAANQVYDRD
ncbi:hypothetical protein HYDPIDRAFT_108265 [Hydnomerulius pinastri MD-312]|nr:hypothetical protein HYDPIDRAFT_108265 [Hydnomerulius pinastri MD-312]